MATASDSDLNLELLGARPSASAEAALRLQFARVRSMTARERVILALELGEAARTLPSTAQPRASR